MARPATATVDGDRLTIENVRNFDYRSVDEYTERWETRTYDLSRIRGADIYLSYWGPALIAHTLVSWEFEDAPPLAISIETRKEVGESYSALKGFFRQFELYYVVADERDVARLRTNVRGEQVYLYRLRGTPEEARALLLDYVDSINRLAAEPTWYNAFVHNCTTTVRHHVANIIGGQGWDWRILANGRVDQLAYERGAINTSMPFEKLRERSRINDRALATRPSDDYSAAIRAGLPARPESIGRGAARDDSSR